MQHHLVVTIIIYSLYTLLII